MRIGSGIPQIDGSRFESLPKGKFYVNLYEQEQCYGGREEGGWWFDRLHPVSSIGFSSTPASRRRARKYIRRLVAEVNRMNAGRPAYTSSRSQGQAVLRLDWFPATTLPKHRPHYE
jgi:hypothetical protein